MHSLSPRAEAVASYAIEVAVLYAALFFVQRQPGAEAVAVPIIVALVPILAFYAHRLERTFRAPYFVWAIGLGWLFQPYLQPLVASTTTLTLLVGLFGVLIIFGGGLDIKFAAFRRLLLPILSLSVVGAVITAALFSLGLSWSANALSLPLTIGTIGLLGAMLCSTDPAAIIPTLRRLRLKNPDDATVAVSESAVNDVVGTIITAVFAALVLGSAARVTSLGELYRHLFSLEVLIDFGKELLVGAVIGYAAYHLLRQWQRNGQVTTAAFPFFIGVALTSYALSTLWGGSGYLAAFVTGLLFEVERGFKDVEHFFVNLVDGFVKPAVFVVLGALITPSFWEYAGLGILASAMFILVVRPIAVGASLALFSGKNKTFRFRDLLFLDAVRETGVIPAVLLVTYSSQLPDGEIAFAVGAWVIIATLVFLPVVTETWARRIGAAS